MLTQDQKRDIWQAVVANFPLTVKGRSITPHMRYPNQPESRKDPAEVVMDYAAEKIHLNWTDIGERVGSRLSINVYSESYKDQSGTIAAEVMSQEIARQLMLFFQGKMGEALSRDVFIEEVSEARNLCSLSRSASSARLRSVMSWTMPKIPTTSPFWICGVMANSPTLYSLEGEVKRISKGGTVSPCKVRCIISIAMGKSSGWMRGAKDFNFKHIPIILPNT